MGRSAAGRDRGHAAVDGAALRLHVLHHEHRELRLGLRTDLAAITLLVFLYFASLVILLGAEFARARALDDETQTILAADPRFLPVAVELPPAPAPARAVRRDAC